MDALAKRRPSILGWLSLLMLAACGGSSSAPPPALWQGARPIGELLARPDLYIEREVVVVAYYRGWDLFGEVGAGPPVSRSDVAVADATGAIYIVPAHPEALRDLPPLQPHRVADTETLLRLRGTVERSAAGTLYLRVVEGKAVEGLPPGVLLRISRTGGLAGFTHELMLTEQGTLYVLDRSARRHGRISVDPRDVHRVIERVRPFAGQEVGAPVPDGFGMTLSFWQGDSVQRVIVSDPSREPLPPGIEEALETVRDWFHQGLSALPTP